MIAFVLGFRAQRGEVRAGAGLGIALAPADFAARDAGQVGRLLLRRAEREQGGAEHGEAEAGARRPRADAAHFLVEHIRVVAREPRSAVFPRPRRNREAALETTLEPELLRRRMKYPAATAPADVFIAARGRAHFGRTVFLEPASD